MCFASAPKLKTPTAPAAVEQAEQQVDTAGQAANDALRKRLRALSGYSATALTGGQGVPGVPNIGKTTLGA